MGYSVYPAPSAATKIQKTDIIKSTQSWTAPADVSTAEVILCGGGGSGAPGSNCGGGGGSVFYSTLSVTPSSTHTITIGAGGAVVGENQVASSSSFGSLMTATGGYSGRQYGGGGVPAGLGGGGGLNAYTSNYIGFNGSNGAFGFGGGGGGAGADANGQGVNGGGSGAKSGTSSATAGAANTGAGGGGAYNASYVAAAGGSGICIIKYWSAL